VLRLAFAAVAIELLEIVGLLLAGGILLLWVCWKMWRELRGPSAEDRVLALDYLSVVAMLMMLVLAIRYDSSMYFEGALLLALFSFVSSVAMAKFLLRGEVIE